MIRVLKWEMIPGSNRPLPIIQDNSDDFHPSFVGNVRQWLLSKQDEFEKQGPTPQLVRARKGKARFLDSRNPRGGNRYKLQPTETLQKHERRVEFEVGTYRVTLKDRRNGLALLYYDYLVAREVSTGQHIVGPQLRYSQLAHL